MESIHQIVKGNTTFTFHFTNIGSERLPNYRAELTAITMLDDAELVETLGTDRVKTTANFACEFAKTFEEAKEIAIRRTKEFFTI